MWPCVLVLVLACSAAWATTVERLSLPEMTARADQVFVGTCQSVDPQTVDGQPQLRYRFRVDQSLKGTAQTEVEIALPGGSAGGTTLRIAGMPTFVAGEESVLFLVGSRPGPVWPAGLGQGAFRILRQGAAKPALVAQQLNGLSLRDPRAAKAAGDAAAGVGPMTLDELLTQVRALLPAAGGGGHGVR